MKPISNKELDKMMINSGVYEEKSPKEQKKKLITIYRKIEKEVIRKMPTSELDGRKM